ncbi:MAG: putative membrane protein, partial [Candidatus Endobugula sp.]
NISKKVDVWLKSDTTAIDDLKKRVEDYQERIAKIPTLSEIMTILAIAFGGTALARWGADSISPFMNKHADFLEKYNLTSLSSDFFWLVVIATTIGVGLSFTKLRKLEGSGASRFGSVFIYILVATIGMQMNIREVLDNPGLFAIGISWMLVHVIIMIGVAKLIKAPFFFVAVGSQANVGGAASAPVVAAAFSPALAPVGVLLAVMGYAVGTYGAILCAYLMEYVAN